MIDLLASLSLTVEREADPAFVAIPAPACINASRATKVAVENNLLQMAGGAIATLLPMLAFAAVSRALAARPVKS